jgi:hypothetical protein
MAIDPVLISFAVQHLADVNKAFASIEQRMLKAEQSETKSAQGGAKTRVKVAKDEAAEKTKIEKQMEQIRRRSSEMAGRLAAQQAKEETRAVERAEAEKIRIRRRSSEMAGRFAAQQAAQEIRAAERAQAAWGHVGKRAGGVIGRSVNGMAGSIGGIGSMALGIGSGMFVADAIRKQLSAEKAAAMLINQVTTGKEPPSGATLSNILGQASQLSRETGLNKELLIGGSLEYSRKARGGDFAGAMANMGFFAKMSQITGADINDVAGAAGTLQSQNPDLDAKQMQQMLLDVYAQGKAGSMSMVDVAKQIGILGSTRSAYAGDAATNQRKLLALGQLAAPEGSIEEAGTFIKDLSMEAGKHRKSTKDTVGLEQMGVKYDKYGRMESPEQMIASVFKGTGGDITKIEKIFGARGTALFRSLQPAYTGAGGGEAGLAAVQAKMASVTGATMTGADLGRQFDQMMSTPAQRFTVAMDRISDTIENKAEPYLERFADALPGLMPKVESFIDEMGQLVSWFSDNPWKGLGALVLGKVELDLAQAGIGAAVKVALQSLIGSMGAGVPSGPPIPAGGILGGGKPGLAAGLGLVGAVAAGAVVAGQFIAGDVELKKIGSKANIAGNNVATNTALALFGKARSGTVTAKDITEAENQAKDIQGLIAAKKKGGWDLMEGPIMKMFEGRAGTNAATGEIKNLEQALRLLNDAVTRSKNALNEHAAAAANATPTNPARSQPIDARTPTGS